MESDIMHVIRKRNVHQILPIGLGYLAECGIPMPSRAGDVLVAPGPVTTVYDRPAERVLFWAERDANPFLHFFESLWILAGRNDVALPARFAQRMRDFSDDGVTFHGAYGHRLRNHFGVDQLEVAVQMLNANPYNRRIVLQLWDPKEDLARDGKDLPCNQSILLNVSFGRRDERNRLNMMVTSRSHDIIWGAYGANAVQFPFIQEYLAGRLNLEIGNLTQVSWNYHAYVDVYNKTRRGALLVPHDECPYTTGEIAPYPLMTVPEAWNRDLLLFFEDPHSYGYTNSFFSQVAKPLWFSHAAFKKKDIIGAIEIVEQCQASDWRKAAREWLLRRKKS